MVLLVRPIYKLFKQHCKAIFEETGMPELQVQTRTDLFAVCWPAVTSAMDEICTMIKSEEAQRCGQPQLTEYPTTTWSLKRTLLGQYFLMMLMSNPCRRGRGAEAKKNITPFTDEVICKEAERRNAIDQGREPEEVQQVEKYSVGADAIEALKKISYDENAVVIIRPRRAVALPTTVASEPGQVPSVKVRSSSAVHSKTAVKRTRAQSADAGDLE